MPYDRFVSPSIKRLKLSAFTIRPDISPDDSAGVTPEQLTTCQFIVTGKFVPRPDIITPLSSHVTVNQAEPPLRRPISGAQSMTKAERVAKPRIVCYSLQINSPGNWKPAYVALDYYTRGSLIILRWALSNENCSDAVDI